MPATLTHLCTVVMKRRRIVSVAVTHRRSMWVVSEDIRLTHTAVTVGLIWLMDATARMMRQRRWLTFAAETHWLRLMQH